jgi:hypothetical protein
MTKFPKTGHPPWARLAWYDAEAIYIEMPVIGSHPIIMKYSFSDDGLLKALKMMKTVYDAAGPHREANGWNLDHPVVKRIAQGSKIGRAAPKVTEESRGIAHRLLKKMGMI